MRGARGEGGTRELGEPTWTMAPLVTTRLDTRRAVAAASAPASVSAGATSASTGKMDKAVSARESTIQEVSEFFVVKCVRLTMSSKIIKHCSALCAFAQWDSAWWLFFPFFLRC